MINLNTFQSSIKENPDIIEQSPNTGSQEVSGFYPKYNIEENNGKLMVSKTIMNNKSDLNKRKQKEEFLNAHKEIKKSIKEVVPELYNVIGLIAVPLNIEKFQDEWFQPWEVTSISELKAYLYYIRIESRKVLTQFSQKSFVRVYPKATRIYSSNYDLTKSWISGCQMVSLNLQTLYDDYTLLNDIFFKTNKNSGFILKPLFLRRGETKSYESPEMYCEFKILSGLFLHKCFGNATNITEIYITIKIIGSHKDDESNFPVTSDIITNNFIHASVENASKTFEIYEKELSFFLIKIFGDNEIVLARSVIPLAFLREGYRVLNLYDINCSEIEQAKLIIYTKFIPV